MGVPRCRLTGEESLRVEAEETHREGRVGEVVLGCLGEPVEVVEPGSQVIDQGTNQLVGRDPHRIVEAAQRVLVAGVPKRRPELWDGKAGERIAKVLIDGCGGPRVRPTDLPV